MNEITDKIIYIDGGHSLKGEVIISGAKNSCQNLLAICLLCDGICTLSNFPDIEDTRVNVKVLEKLGTTINWDKIKNIITIDTSTINSNYIDPELAIKTTASKQFIPPLVLKMGEVITGVSGGDKIGGENRYNLTDNIIEHYRKLGIGTEKMKDNQIRFYKLDNLENMYQKNRYFGITLQGIISFVLSRSENQEKLYIENPSFEPEILQAIDMLKDMGAKITIEYDSNSHPKSYIIEPVNKLIPTSCIVMSDPNELMTYVCMTLATRGDVNFKNVDYNDKIQAIINIIKEIGADVTYNQTDKTLSVSALDKQLNPIDVFADFWPTKYHTDWGQLLMSICATIQGDSTYTDNVYEKRTNNLNDFEKFGINIKYEKGKTRFNEGNHKIVINGQSSKEFKCANVTCPDDVRGASAMLCVKLVLRSDTVVPATLGI